MKINRNQAKELLMDFARFDDGNVPENWIHQLTPKISRYLEAKYKDNLALGKPEPLAKNKQTQERTCDECRKLTTDFYKNNTTCEDCLCPEGA